MPYWQLFYHIVTTTFERKRLLTPSVEPCIFQYLKEKCYSLGGELYAINGVEDHVHLVVTIPPKIAVATFIGQLKGYASAQYNRSNPKAAPFQWQEEYGVFSFDKKRLPPILAYVEGQKDHHRAGDLVAALERTAEESGHCIADSADDYSIDSSLDQDNFPQFP